MSETASVRLPADYYATPPGDKRPLFPRWVPFGCGIASAVLIVVLFAGGAFLSTGGMPSALGWFLGKLQTELATMYAPDVPQPTRDEVRRELESLRANLRSGRVPISRFSPVMETVKDAIDDQKVTNAEAQKILTATRTANAPAPAKK